MAEKVCPPSVLTDHWTLGVGLPVALAVNDAFWPRVMVSEVGLPPFEITGAVATVSDAAEVVVEPIELVKIALNVSLFRLEFTPVIVSVPVLAPVTVPFWNGP